MPAEHPDVRLATYGDLPALADTLADAFLDYPWTRWALPSDDYSARLRAVQLYFVERVGLPYGRVWTAAGGTAASVWTVPDVQIPDDLFAAPELFDLYGDRAAATAAADELLAPHRPSEPCWFLATVGVRRNAQGGGLGSAVIAPGLAAADQSGHLAFLETADEGNVRFYQHLGFEVTAEVSVPGDAPRTWCMARPPIR